MSHELTENLKRRHQILVQLQQRPRGADITTLTQIIMGLGYTFRGAKRKIKELMYGGWIKEENLRFYVTRQIEPPQGQV